MAEVLNLPVEFIGEPYILYVDDNKSRRALVMQSFVRMHVTIVEDNTEPTPERDGEPSSFDSASIQNVVETVSAATSSGSLQASFVHQASVIAAEKGQVQGENDVMNAVFSAEVPIVENITPTRSPTPSSVTVQTNDGTNSKISFEVIAVLTLCFCVGVAITYKCRMKKRTDSIESDSLEAEKQVLPTDCVEKRAASPNTPRKYQTSVLAVELHSPEALVSNELDSDSVSDTSLYRTKDAGFHTKDISQISDSSRSRRTDFDTL
jgi:hypothetical protein